MTTQANATTPTVRLIDYAEALSGPYAMPRFLPEGLDRWAEPTLLELQQWMLSRAYGLSMGAPRAPRPALNAPVTLAEVAEAVLWVAEPFAAMVDDMRRLIKGRHVSEAIEHRLLQNIYAAVLTQVVQELERRHGERARPSHAALH